jgi:hypothetical protein
MMKRIFLLAVFLILSGFIFALDYGGTIEERFEADNELFKNTIGLSPWFSWDINEDLYLYLSGILSIDYYKYGNSWIDNYYGGWVAVPEISLFMLSYIIDNDMSIRVGRVNYSDILGYTASGLFDGVNFKMMLPVGNLDTGLYFTGLLYKETAKVVMTTLEKFEYENPWRNSDPSGKYFASNRLFLTGRLDMPFPLYDAINFSSELLLQFDVNGEEQVIHSQYLEASIEYSPKDMMRVSGGILIEVMENNHGDVGAAFGLLAQGKMALVETPFNDFVGVTLKFTSASTSDAFTAFTPITSTPQGNVFSQSLEGLLLIGADYSARVIESLYTEAALRYFIRTYSDSYAKGYLYGPELWAFASWRHFEDIRVNLGVGLFFPGLGNVYPSNTDLMWKVTFGLAIFL